MEDSTVPVYDDVLTLSQGSAVNKRRYDALVEQFIAKYGCSPRYIARAPGRVNLIGEHIDYCGYGVLPMAIEQDIAMAFTPTDTNDIHISNTQSCYESQVIDIGSYAIEGVAWYNYFLCGFKGIVEHFNIGKPCGMCIMTDGTVPPSSGLSSSSALVCCASIVTLFANGIADGVSKKELADLCARSERFIGTQGGGMDQAVSFLAEVGKAIKIDFNPLVCTPLSLPDGYSFVIANCGVSMNKAATLSFNERVVECRLSAKLIATIKGLNWKEIDKFLQVQQALSCTLQEMPSVVKECLHEEFYSKEEICQLLGITNIEEAIVSMSPQAKEAANRLNSYRLYQRAMHVFQEAGRVTTFQKMATLTHQEGVGVKLGQLMNDSHYSCSNVYECSCPELDRLVQVCTSQGALGCRLTGAGWGGCTVSIVDNQQLDEFMAGVRLKYYNDKMEETQLFATRPGPGAAVCRFEN